MDSRTIRDAQVLVPSVEVDLLDKVDTIDDGAAEFDYGPTEARQVTLKDDNLRNGRLKGVRADKFTLEAMSLDSVIFDGCVFQSIDISECRLSRVRFVNCQLNGLRLSNTKLADVVFEQSRLDYGTWQEVRATRPVAFIECSLHDTSLVDCAFERAVFDRCRLDELEIVGGKYAGCDLRGNDLSSVRGVMSLKRARIERSQLQQLVDAVAQELELVVDDNHY